MELEITLTLLGMLGTSLITVGGVILGYHNYLMRQINKRLKKETYYIDQEKLDKQLEEIKNSSEKQKNEIKAMITKLGDKMEADYQKIYDHLLNCNRRNG